MLPGDKTPTTNQLYIYIYIYIYKGMLGVVTTHQQQLTSNPDEPNYPGTEPTRPRPLLTTTVSREITVT